MSRLRWNLVVLLSAMALLSGCKRREGAAESMSAGHATIGASDAVYDVAVFLAQEFRSQNANAWIDVFRDSNRALIDSLINDKAEEIFLDRVLTPAETLAFGNAKLKLFQYPVAYYPVFLLADRGNPVEALDSASLRGILTGAVDSWQRLGGPDEPVSVYLPAPGDGAFVSLVSFFGGLDSMEAEICSTSAAMLDSAEGDPGALLVWSKPVDQLRDRYKVLRFDRGEGREITPNVATILDTLGYPFRLDLTYVTTHNKADVAAGYLTFMVGNLGQRRLMDGLRYRPAAVPVRMVRLK